MDFFKQAKKYIVVISIFVFLVIIILFLSKRYEKDNIVETTRRTEDSSLPQINIENEDIDNLNHELETLYKQYITHGKNTFAYRTNNYGNIVSILISIDEFLNEIYPYRKKFLSYHIDRSGKILSDDELISLFGVTMEEVENKVLKQLEIYYYEEDSLEYFEKEECDFSCYLSFVRNIIDIKDSIAVTIENNQLVAYVGFDKNSFYEDMEYFDSLNKDIYKVIIK